MPVLMKSVPTVEFGSLCILWNDRGGGAWVVRVFLSRPGLSSEALARRTFPRAVRAEAPGIDDLAGELEGLLRGSVAGISTDRLDFSLCTPYQNSVLRFLEGVPRGSITSYGRIAREVGGSARSVGRALASSPFPLVLPCHRVVRGNMTPGGYQGGSAMKTALLEMEGVQLFERESSDDR